MRTLTILTISALLCFVACAPKGAVVTPPSPTPPQIKLAQDVNVLAQSLDTAMTALRAARDAGKVSSADVLNADKVSVIIAQTGKQINAELRTGDDWPTMRGKVLKIITSAGMAAATGNLPPNVAGYIAVAVSAFNAISASVGGPLI